MKYDEFKTGDPRIDFWIKMCEAEERGWWVYPIMALVISVSLLVILYMVR